jgi:hypothetical protein
MSNSRAGASRPVATATIARLFRSIMVRNLSPFYGSNLDSLMWVGRSKDIESFGKGSNAYYLTAADANTAEGKLSARFRDCVTNIARRSYRNR